MFFTNVPSFYALFLPPVFFLYYAFSFVLPPSSKPGAKMWLFFETAKFGVPFWGCF